MARADGLSAARRAGKRSSAQHGSSAVPSVGRTVSILKLLAASPAPMALKSVASRTDLIPSTCLRILRALVAEGLVHFDEDNKRYSIGVGIVPLAARILNGSFARTIQPELDALSRKYGATAIGLEAGNNRWVVVAIARPRNQLSLQAAIGTRFPLLLGASGRCMAAFGRLGDREIKRQFGLVHWDRPPLFQTWLTEVERVRARGFGLDRNNYIDGLTIVSAPIFSTQRDITHTIMVACVSREDDDRMLEALSEELRESAQRVSHGSQA